MAATSPAPAEDSYEEFVRLHADRFTSYLRGVLGRQAEGRGGRVAVDDTLQEALLAIYAEWPELRQVRVDERDRRMYRCLRDAAGQALRSEHGRQAQGSARPRIVSFDFGALHAFDDDRPAHERELTAAVLGAMVRDMAAVERDGDARASLDRGMLVAGLRALSEREAVVLIAVDYLGWDQHQLADRLEIGFSALRQTLFGARKVFYALVRHAVGVEVDEEERGRLAAYLAGELAGAEKREARRHLQHCQACQALQREQRVFGRDAFGVLAPLPFIFGAKALVKRSSTKAAAVGSGAGAGLFAQPGAAKAMVAVVGLLGVGVGASAVLGELHDHRVSVGHHVAAPASSYAIPAGMTRIKVPIAAASTPPKKRSQSTKRQASRSKPKHSSSSATTRAPTQAVTPSQSTQQPADQQPSVAKQPTGKSTTSGGGGCEFFGC